MYATYIFYFHFPVFVLYLFYPSLHLHFTSYLVWNKIFQFTKINSKISGAYLGKYLRIIRTRLRLCPMIFKKFVKRRNAIDWKPASWQTFFETNPQTDRTLANKFVSLTIDFQVGSTTSFCVIAATQIWQKVCLMAAFICGIPSFDEFFENLKISPWQTSLFPWQLIFKWARPRLSVWSQPHKFGTAVLHFLCTFISQAESRGEIEIRWD